MPKVGPKELLPTLFHLWDLQSRSSLYDFQALDAVATLVSDAIYSISMPITKYGLLEKDQLSTVFSAMLRLLEVPVSYVGSPYVANSETVSMRSDKDKKSRAARPIASLVVYSLCGELCLEEDGMLDRLESLIHAVETFVHPSNNGPWTRNIIQAVCTMVELFVMRWNVQANGEALIPQERFVTEKVKDRFVEILRDVAFLGIHSKSSSVVSYSLEALQGLAFLSPQLIIPRVLNEVYPSLQGLVETHRTLSSLKMLTVLTRMIAQNPQYAIHLTTLLGLAIPGIDANDLSKTLHSLSFIQSAALNIPFYDISGDIGPGVAMEYISGAVASIEETNVLAEVPPEVVPDVLKSSTAAFGEFVILFIGRVFTMLENLPDQSASKSRDLPEAHVINTLPPAMTAVLGALSPELYNTCVTHVVDFVANNVIHNATDAVAHICGCIVKVNPAVAFPKLFPVLYTNIKHEVLENHAGSTRSGSEILPRDRALIWNLSALNMSVAHAGSEVLAFKDQIMEITHFLRDRCKGSVVYHISNTVHHVLLTLTTTFVTDLRLVEPGTQVSISNWGEKVDPHKLNLKWHVPTRDEVEFACELYNSHCEKSSTFLTKVMTGEKNGMSATEFSDMVSSNLTYIRTATSGIALLFDPNFDQTSSSSASGGGVGNETAGDYVDEYSDSDDSSDDGSEFEGDGSDFEGDEDLMEDALLGDEDDLEAEGDLAELKKLREYPTNYFFAENKSDPLYLDLHRRRLAIGTLIHDVHSYLNKNNHDGDIACFKALLFVYKVWFSDVGIERTARSLESYIALYSYESKNFRIPGLRKDFPRPVLARRASLYHIERLSHNAGPRQMTDLEKTLLFDIAKSTFSIFPDIRRNAQASFESAVKVLIRSRPVVYPWILKELNGALESKDFKRTESGLRLLNIRIMMSGVKKDFKNVTNYISIIRQSLEADYPPLNGVGSVMCNYFVSSLRLPLNVAHIDDASVDNIKPTDTDVAGKIHRLQHRKLVKREQAEREMLRLVASLVESAEIKGELHWKIVAVYAGVFTALCSSPQMKTDPRVLTQLAEGSLSPHPGIRAICMHGLFRITNKIVILAMTNYNYDRFLIDYDEDSDIVASDVYVDSSKPGFTDEFDRQLRNVESPDYFMERSDTVGWLVWGDGFIAERPNFDPDMVKVSDDDRKAVEALGAMVNVDWVTKVIDRHLEEQRGEEDYFEVTNAIFFKIIFRLMFAGFTAISLDEFLDVVQTKFNPEDKNSHRSTAEICAALMDSLSFSTKAADEKKLEFLAGMVTKVFNNHLAHDNLQFWRSFLWWSSAYIDPRRAWPVYKIVNEFRVERSWSGFKDSSRISLLRKSIAAVGWHYRIGVDAILDNLWDNIDHSLQSVREEVAKTLASLYIASYHESVDSVEKLIEDNAAAGELGLLAYQFSPALLARIEDAFARLEKWREERDLFSSTSQYILAAKTLSLFLTKMLQRSCAIGLIPLLAKTIIPALLHFLNVRDDQEIMQSGVTLFKYLGNIPYPTPQVQHINDMIRDIGVHATSWHQRMSILSYIQAFFFRQLFKMTHEQRLHLYDSVTLMLEDPQLEVRELAADTLAGMIRCSPVSEQNELTSYLHTKFVKVLEETKGWRDLRRTPANSGRATPVPSQPGTPTLRVPGVAAAASASNSGLLSARAGTPTSEYQQVLIKRHSAVLGLGSLVKAFPYQSPPPKWVPKVLATLAVKAASDAGMVGKSVKSTLSDFKKTRQDTWHIDSKVFSAEELEDLEGVLWKNYFA